MWVKEPELFTYNYDLEGHRLRFLASVKGSPVVSTVLTISEELPVKYNLVNPSRVTPFMIDKGVSLYDLDSIEQYIHERFPSPATFAGVTPAARALTRQLVSGVRAWYRELRDDSSTSTRWNICREAGTILGEAGSEGPFFFGKAFTVVDVAMAPLLYELRCEIHNIPNKKAQIRRYAKTLTDAQAFRNTHFSYRPPPVKD